MLINVSVYLSVSVSLTLGVCVSLFLCLFVTVCLSPSIYPSLPFFQLQTPCLCLWFYFSLENISHCTILSLTPCLVSRIKVLSASNNITVSHWYPIFVFGSPKVLRATIVCHTLSPIALPCLWLFYTVSSTSDTVILQCSYHVCLFLLPSLIFIICQKHLIFAIFFQYSFLCLNHCNILSLILSVKLRNSFTCLNHCHILSLILSVKLHNSFTCLNHCHILSLILCVKLHNSFTCLYHCHILSLILCAKPYNTVFSAKIIVTFCHRYFCQKCQMSSSTTAFSAKIIGTFCH